MIDDGNYRAALDRHGVDRRDMFSRFTTDGVLWADGTHEPVDTIVFAAGCRPTLDYVTGSGTLDETGAPLHRRSVSTTVEGLGFVGPKLQRSFSSKTQSKVGRDANWLLQRLAEARR